MKSSPIRQWDRQEARTRMNQDLVEATTKITKRHNRIIIDQSDKMASRRRHSPRIRTNRILYLGNRVCWTYLLYNSLCTNKQPFDTSRLTLYFIRSKLTRCYIVQVSKQRFLEPSSIFSLYWKNKWHKQYLLCENRLALWPDSKPVLVNCNLVACR